MNDQKFDNKKISTVLSKALRALCITRDYVGPKNLPAIDGWEWYEAGKVIASIIPDDEWSEEFWKRVREYERKHNGTSIKLKTFIKRIDDIRSDKSPGQFIEEYLQSPDPAMCATIDAADNQCPNKPVYNIKTEYDEFWLCEKCYYNYTQDVMKSFKEEAKKILNYD